MTFPYRSPKAHLPKAISSAVLRIRLPANHRDRPRFKDRHITKDHYLPLPLLESKPYYGVAYAASHRV